MKQRPWGNTAYCLTPNDLLCLLSFNTQDNPPRDYNTIMACALSHQSSIRKIPNRFASRSSFGDSLFPDKSRFALSWHKLTITGWRYLFPSWYKLNNLNESESVFLFKVFFVCLFFLFPSIFPFIYFVIGWTIPLRVQSYQCVETGEANIKLK